MFWCEKTRFVTGEVVRLPDDEKFDGCVTDGLTYIIDHCILCSVKRVMIYSYSICCTEYLNGISNIFIIFICSIYLIKADQPPHGERPLITDKQTIPMDW